MAAEAPAAETAAAKSPAVLPTAAPTIPLPTLAPFPKTKAQPVPTQKAPKQAAPPVSPTAENLPSPADAQASAGQGLAAIPETSGQPELDAFIASVRNGVANRLSGVYVPGQFALPVIQQPAGDGNFVDGNDGTTTEYARSAAFNVVGLLAHNTLSSGKAFFKLKPGQEVVLVYGNGRQARFRIERVENYQALGPNDPYSDFIDLNGPGGQLVRNEELFQRIYTHPGQLVFQTCFEANGDPSWGRMFVIANPV